MKTFSDNSIDFICCDPPYGINFMGCTFDKFKNQAAFNPEYWKEALRICKPGSMLAAFGGDRTHHHLMHALEQAGWEIRTCIYWLTGQGFPKSHNNFGLEGYGTALKPAAEIIVLCMKPLDGTYKQNVEKWGLGGININLCRIGNIRDVPASHSKNKNGISIQGGMGLANENELNPNIGRWPSNLLLDEESAEMLDRQSGISKSSDSIRYNSGNAGTVAKGKQYPHEGSGYSDTGGASRFFYCAKASSKERNAGLESPSTHPTVKPLSLMRYIIKLLAPPGDPLLLDPFAGSASTLIAAKQLGIGHIGIELSPEYCEIARIRLEHWKEFDPELPI